MAATRILILFAHPALERSRINRPLCDAVHDLEGVTFHDLYQHYPDFDIDVPREQQLLLDHDLIVMQHPFYWYSTPALIKEWEDLVLQHGWAYGSEGTALNGKSLLSAITTGGKESTYVEGGAARYTMRQFLRPIEQTARLCGMRYLTPYVIHGTFLLNQADIAAEAAAYRRTLEALRDDRVDLQAADRLPRMNSDLDAIIAGPGEG